MVRKSKVRCSNGQTTQRKRNPWKNPTRIIG